MANTVAHCQKMLPFLYLLLVVSLNDPEKLQKHGLDGIFAVT